MEDRKIIKLMDKLDQKEYTKYLDNLEKMTYLERKESEIENYVEGSLGGYCYAVIKEHEGMFYLELAGSPARIRMEASTLYRLELNIVKAIMALREDV
jgi:hypothetical protein